MMIETKNTITAKFELTKEEKVILSEAENILKEVFKRLREVSAVTLEDLTQIAEEEVFCLIMNLKILRLFLLWMEKHLLLKNKRRKRYVILYFGRFDRLGYFKLYCCFYFGSA